MHHLIAEHGELTKETLKTYADNINQHDTEVANYTPLHVAVCARNIKALKLLLKHPYIDPNLGDNGQYTPLHFATFLGYEDVVSLLIAHLKVEVNQKDKQGFPAIQYAKYFKYQNIAKLIKLKQKDYQDRIIDSTNQWTAPLLKKNQRPLTNSEQDETIRFQILSLTVGNIDANYRQLESEQANMSLRCTDKKSLIYYLVHHDCSTKLEEIVLSLIDKDKCNLNDNDIYEILERAIQKGWRKLVRKLFDKYFQSSQRTISTTLLLSIVVNNNEDLVKNLVDLSVVTEKADDYSLATSLACIKGYYNIVYLLVKHKPDVLIQKDNIWPALHEAVCCPHNDRDKIVKFLLDEITQRPELKNLGLIDKQEKMGQTALHMAIKRYYYTTAELLLKYGAEYDVPDKYGVTPYKIANDILKRQSLANLFTSQLGSPKRNILSEPIKEKYKIDGNLFLNFQKKSLFVETESIYVEPYAKGFMDYDSSKKLRVIVNDFIKYTNLKTLCITGESGSGKTYFLEHLYHSCFENRNKLQLEGIIYLLIDANTLKNNKGKNLWELINIKYKLYYSYQQLDAFKKVVMIDSFDLVFDTINEVLNTEFLGHIKCNLILTCNTASRWRYNDINSEIQWYNIEYFSDMQIEEYLEMLKNKKPRMDTSIISKWCSKELLRIPLILKLASEAIDLVKNDKKDDENIGNLLEFYNFFTNKILIEYEHLATDNTYEEKLIQQSYYYLVAEGKDKSILSNLREKNKRKLPLFLKDAGSNIHFVHDSIASFFCAKYIVININNNSKDIEHLNLSNHPLNKILLKNSIDLVSYSEPSLFYFIVSMLRKEKDKYCSLLVTFLMKNRFDQSLGRLGSNVLSLLNKLDYSFYQKDLRGIQAPDADLGHCMIYNCPLEGADLKGANIENGLIVETHPNKLEEGKFDDLLDKLEPLLNRKINLENAYFGHVPVIPLEYPIETFLFSYNKQEIFYTKPSGIAHNFYKIENFEEKPESKKIEFDNKSMQFNAIILEPIDFSISENKKYIALVTRLNQIVFIKYNKKCVFTKSEYITHSCVVFLNKDNKKLFLTGDQAGYINLWQFRNNKLKKTTVVCLGKEIRYLKLSRDMSYLAVAYNQPGLAVYTYKLKLKSESNDKVFEMDLQLFHEEATLIANVIALDFSHQSKYLSFAIGKTVYTLILSQKRLHTSILNTNMWINSICFNPAENSETILAVAGRNSYLSVWDVEKNRQVNSININLSRINKIQYVKSQNQLYLVVCSKNSSQLHLWNCIEPHYTSGINKFYHTNWVYRVRFNMRQEKSFIYSSGRDSCIIIYEILQNNLHAISKLNPHKKQIFTLAVSPDNKYYASGANDNKVIVWNTYDWRKLYTYKFKYPVLSLAFDNDSTFIYVGCGEGTLARININEERVDFIAPDTSTQSDDIFAIVGGPFSSIYYSAGKPGKRALYELNVDTMDYKLKHTSESTIYALAQIENYIIYGTHDGFLNFYYKEHKPERRYYYEIGKRPIYDLAIYKGNKQWDKKWGKKYLLACVQGLIIHIYQLYNIGKPTSSENEFIRTEESYKLIGHHDEVLSLTFCDDRSIVSAGIDHMVIYWRHVSDMVWYPVWRINPKLHIRILSEYQGSIPIKTSIDGLIVNPDSSVLKQDIQKDDLATAKMELCFFVIYFNDSVINISSLLKGEKDNKIQNQIEAYPRSFDDIYRTHKTLEDAIEDLVDRISYFKSFNNISAEGLLAILKPEQAYILCGGFNLSGIRWCARKGVFHRSLFYAVDLYDVLNRRIHQLNYIPRQYNYDFISSIYNINFNDEAFFLDLFDAINVGLLPDKLLDDKETVNHVLNFINKSLLTRQQSLFLHYKYYNYIQNINCRNNIDERLFTLLAIQLYKFGEYAKASDLLENNINIKNLIENEYLLAPDFYQSSTVDAIEAIVTFIIINTIIGKGDHFSNKLSSLVMIVDYIKDKKFSLGLYTLQGLQEVLAFIFAKNNESEKALGTINDAFELRKEVKNKSYINRYLYAKNLDIYGDIFIYTGKIEQAIKKLEKAAKFRRYLPPHELAYCISHLADACLIKSIQENDYKSFCKATTLVSSALEVNEIFYANFYIFYKLINASLFIDFCNIIDITNPLYKNPCIGLIEMLRNLDQNALIRLKNINNGFNLILKGSKGKYLDRQITLYCFVSSLITHEILYDFGSSLGLDKTSHAAKINNLISELIKYCDNSHINRSSLTKDEILKNDDLLEFIIQSLDILPNAGYRLVIERIKVLLSSIKINLNNYNEQPKESIKNLPGFFNNIGKSKNESEVTVKPDLHSVKPVSK